MTKKRVIIIRNAYTYDFGGGERYPVFLAENLQKNDYETLIISRSPKLLAFAKGRSIKTLRGWWWSRQNWSGIRVFLFPVYLIWQIALFFWYLKVFKEYQPDVIHIQSKDDFISATWAGELLMKKVIWTDHADLKHIWKNISVWYKNPVGKLVHYSAKFTDAIIAISKSELSLINHNLDKNDIIKNKIHVIYNGVSDDAKNYKKSKDKKDFSYCVVSRMVTDKGISEVIEAFSRLQAKYPKDNLILIGDGPEMKDFKKTAKKIKNIKFMGYQKDPLKYLVEADILVHPTYHEGFGLSLVEASMLEKPIIASSVGGIMEIITHRKNGLLVKPKDVNSLCSAMESLRNDTKLRKLLGSNARTQYEKKFDFDKIVKKQIIPLYKGMDI